MGANNEIWCYYTRVVSYLERLEATQAAKTQTGAYLVWRDEDGPWMVAGPDTDWFRGDGPCPLGDLAGLTMSVKNKAMAARPACRHHAKKQQSRGRKPAVRTANQAQPAAKVDKFATQKPARPKRTSQAIQTKCHAGSSAIAAAKPIAGENQSGGRPCPPNKGKQKAYAFSETCSNLLTAKRHGRGDGSACSAPSSTNFTLARPSIRGGSALVSWYVRPRETQARRPTLQFSPLAERFGRTPADWRSLGMPALQ